MNGVMAVPRLRMAAVLTYRHGGRPKARPQCGLACRYQRPGDSVARILSLDVSILHYLLPVHLLHGLVVCVARKKRHICALEALRPAVWSATSQDLSMNFVISLRSELCLPITVQVSRAMRTLPRVLGARARTVGRLPQRSAKFVAAIQTPVVTPVFRTLRMSAAGQSVPAPIALVAALRAS